VVILPNLS